MALAYVDTARAARRRRRLTYGRELEVVLNDLCLVHHDLASGATLRGVLISEVRATVAYDDDGSYEIILFEDIAERREPGRTEWRLTTQREKVRVESGPLFDLLVEAAGAHDDYIRNQIADDIRERRDDAALTAAEARADLAREDRAAALAAE